jgi:hypothetical protein
MSTPAPTSTPGALPGRPFPPEQAQTLDDLITRTVELRGLEPTGGVEQRLIGRQEAGDYLQSTFGESDREDIALKQDVYRLLGLIPDDADLLELQMSLVRALILGFYDPDIKALFVLDDLGLNSVITRTTIVHEIVHALQDQHYDLNAVDRRLHDDWDATMAWVALVEGDARGTETEFVSPSAANNPGLACNDLSFAVNRNSSIPAVIQRELQAPYTDGLCFVTTVKPRLPQGTDSAFQDLPNSAEQVLHPEKYLEGEDPEPPELAPLADRLGAGWAELASSTFGEFTLQNLLLLGLSDIDAVKSGADGWGGDRWALYGREDGARLIHLATAWDSEAEARGFWQAFIESLDARAGGSLNADPSSPSVTWEQSARTLRASLSGDTVTVVMSTDPAAAQTAAQALGLG